MRQHHPPRGENSAAALQPPRSRCRHPLASRRSRHGMARRQQLPWWTVAARGASGVLSSCARRAAAPLTYPCHSARVSFGTDPRLSQCAPAITHRPHAPPVAHGLQPSLSAVSTTTQTGRPRPRAPSWVKRAAFPRAAAASASAVSLPPTTRRAAQ